MHTRKNYEKKTPKGIFQLEMRQHGGGKRHRGAGKESSDGERRERPPTESRPGLTQGFFLWRAAWGLLGAAAVDTLTLPFLFAFVSVVVVMFLMNWPRYTDSSQPTPAAFFSNYWGMPEPFIHAPVMALVFIMVLMGVDYTNTSSTKSLMTGAIVGPLAQALVVLATSIYGLSAGSVRGKGARWQIIGQLEASVLLRIVRATCETIVISTSCVFVLVTLRNRGAGDATSPTSLTSLEYFSIHYTRLLALGLQLDWPGHTGYYRWFAASGLELAKSRGLGFNACKPFGILSMPRLSPWALNHLSPLLAIILISISFVPRVELLALFTACFLLFASQVRSPLRKNYTQPLSHPFSSLILDSAAVFCHWAEFSSDKRRRSGSTVPCQHSQYHTTSPWPSASRRAVDGEWL